MINQSSNRNNRSEGAGIRSDDVPLSTSSVQVLVELGEYFGIFSDEEAKLRFCRAFERFRSLSAVVGEVVCRIFRYAYWRYHDRWLDEENEMDQWRIRYDLRTFWGTQGNTLPDYVVRVHQVFPALGGKQELLHAS